MGPLLQREAELARIDAVLASASSGRGAALFIEGPAGIGKTSLLGHARRRAETASMATLSGRGTELERGYAFGVVRQCLVAAVHAHDAARARLFDGAAQLAAPVVLDGTSGEAPANPFAILHGLYWLLANLTAARPAVLAVDDAQWADEPSLRLLAFLVRRIESLPLAVLIAARVEELAGPRGALWEARADPVTEVLQPRPLGPAAVATFLAIDAPDVEEPFVSACHRATGGNPFLLGHLARTLQAEGVPFTAAGAEVVSAVRPPEIARSVRALLARQEPEAAALAAALAILGDHATLAEAAELVGLQAGAATTLAAALASAGLLEDDLPPRFRHPLLRGAVMAAMGGVEREALHRRAAQLLAARGASAERRSLHLLEVEPVGSAEVVATLRDAARRARGRGAPASAAVLLDRALGEPPSAEERHAVLLELAEAEHAAGDAVAAEQHAAAAYEAAPDSRARAAALLLWGTAMGPDLAAMAALGERVESALAELGEDDRELTLELRAAALFAMLPDPDPDPARLAAVAEEVDRLPGDTPGEARVLGIHVFQRTRHATANEIAQLAERAARHAPALMAEGADTMAFSGIVLGLRWSERLELAERLLLDAIEVARRQGSAPAFAFASMNLSEVRRRRGMLPDAEADARSGIAAGEGWTAVMPAGALAACLLDQGRVEEAWEALVDAGLRGPIDPAPPLTELLLVRVRVRVGAGDHQAALADWRDAVARRVRGAPEAGWIENRIAVGEALRAGGDDAAAREIVYEALDAARRWGTPGVLGEALRGLARVGGERDAVDLLRESLAALERSPLRLEHARALVDLGAALRRHGARRDSRPPLKEGLVLAGRCGASGLAEAARQELAAAGVRMNPDAPGGAGLLTASERRIADLAGAGASNAQIAQALFVTVKTVEMHLTHSYRKLGIAKRTELADAMQSH